MNPVSAGLLEELNSTYITDVSQLPPYKESELTIDETVQTSGHIQGWVDLIGFTGTAEINGTFYIRGDPLKAAVIRYNAWDTITCEKCFVNQWDKEISVYREGDKITARLRVWMEWCDKIECRRELAYFYVT